MSRNLAAYFSARGTTAKVAKLLAGAAKADLYAIKPNLPYTLADLDWTSQKSGGSGLGQTAAHLRGSVSVGTIILEGKLLNDRQSRSSLAAWTDSLTHMKK